MNRKKIRLILIIFVCISSLAMLITGPILLQEYIGHRVEFTESDGTTLYGEIIGQNIILCWVGAILIASPVLALTITCFVFLVKKVLSGKKGNDEIK